MGLSSLQLDAFFVAARTLNFSRAAEELHITQSALTQRIKSLESDLGLTLFIRKPRGVELSASGGRLLRYCQARARMEEELIGDLKGDASGLGGVVRIAAASSILRSVVVPALAPLVRAEPRIQMHCQKAELFDLPELLLTGEVDYIVLDRDMDRADIESVRLGEEEYLMVESREFAPPPGVYLDHHPQDPITYQFLRLQSHDVPNFRRSYFTDIYLVTEGVAQGYGRAVIPRHLCAQDPRLRVLDGFRPMRTPVVLHHFEQPFYTALHKAVVAHLARNCGPLLEAGASPR